LNNIATGKGEIRNNEPWSSVVIGHTSYGYRLQEGRRRRALKKKGAKIVTTVSSEAR